MYLQGSANVSGTAALIMIFMRDPYMLHVYILPGFSERFEGGVESDNDIHDYFDTPTQYEYNLVLTCAGVDGLV